MAAGTVVALNQRMKSIAFMRCLRDLCIPVQNLRCCKDDSTSYRNGTFRLRDAGIKIVYLRSRADAKISGKDKCAVLEVQTCEALRGGEKREGETEREENERKERKRGSVFADVKWIAFLLAKPDRFYSFFCVRKRFLCNLNVCHFFR